MMADVPSDLFSGVDALADSPVDDSPAGDDTDDSIDIPEPDEATDEVAEEAEPVEAAPEAEPADKEAKPAEATEEELPEGVRKGKDRKGKDGYFLEENRYKTFHGNHQIVQQAAEILGEPLTLDAIKLRNAAYEGQERLFTDLTSGDPAGQSEVVSYILNEMKTAQAEGRTGIDPVVPFAETVYNTLQKDSPDGYARLRMLSANALLEEMFGSASSSGNRALFQSAVHFAGAIAGLAPKPGNWTDEQYLDYAREVTKQKGITFHTEDEMADLARAEDPVASRDKRIADLESKLNGRSETSSAAQFETWARNNVQTVNSAVLNDVVLPALTSVKDNWKQFPSEFQDLVVDRLNRLVSKDVRADTGLDRKVSDLRAQAKRATSEQVRADLGERIRQQFIHRANQAVEKHKPAVLKFAAESLKGRSEATHERRTGAQTHTAPKGPSAPVKTSLLPKAAEFKNGIFDTSTAVRQMQQLLGGR